jgi:hypothetical protein
MNWGLTTMSQRMRLLRRLIVAHVVLFGAAMVNATWAEDAAPGGILDTKTSGRSISGEGDAGTKGSEKTKVDENAADKVDSNTGNMGEHHTGSTGGAKGEEGTNSKGVWHGEDDSKPRATDLGPIDTRITVLGKPRFGYSKVHGWKKSKIVRPSGNSHDSHRIWTRATTNGVVRNAIGLPVVRQMGADSRGTDIKGFEGSVVRGPPKSTSSPGNGGMEVPGADFHRQGFVPLGAGGVRLHDPPINTAINRSIISGRDMVRPGLGTSVIGGPAKNLAGGINGTNFRPRHP